jgi:hypothetical protein
MEISEVQEIRIFKSTSTGAETTGKVNIWRYTGEQSGPEVDPGPGVAKIDFTQISAPWPACMRVNGGGTPDSIGVTVIYRYNFVTPLASVIDAIASGNFSLTLSETTVMALNPSN